MTLNTSLINREARDLYLRYLKDPSIPDELCSDIYLDFVERLRAYRKKQEKKNGKSKIKGGLLREMIRRTTQSIFQKKEKGEKKEQVLNNIVGRNTSSLWNNIKSDEEMEFFHRIGWYLKEWVKRKKNYPQYLHVFILYHAFHLSPDFILNMAAGTGINDEELLRQVGDVKETIRQRINKRLERKMEQLGLQYFNMVKKQINLKGGLRIEQYDCSNKDYQIAVRKREQALKAIKEMKYFPTWVEIEKITAISERKARYAYQCVIKAIKEFFKDDSYWSGV